MYSCRYAGGLEQSTRGLRICAAHGDLHMHIDTRTHERTNARTHARTHALTQHTHIHARARAHTGCAQSVGRRSHTGAVEKDCRPVRVQKGHSHLRHGLPRVRLRRSRQRCLLGASRLPSLSLCLSVSLSSLFLSFSLSFPLPLPRCLHSLTLCDALRCATLRTSAAWS